MSMDSREIPAGQFKQRCLAILDEVAATHREYIVTKRGRPVARVVSIVSDREKEDEILASMRGRGRVLVDEETLLQPLTGEAGWDLGDLE